MAKLFIPFTALVLLVASSTSAESAPNETTSQSTVQNKPVMLNKIFAEPNAKKPSRSSSSNDILQLGLSKSDAAQPTKSTSPVMAVATSAAALIFVVGIFLLIAWLMKRGAPRGLRSLPSEAFEILGRSSLNANQAVQLVRLGNKLLLVASSSEGAATLTEIDDPAEVERLSGMCMTSNDTSATQEFHEAFEQLAAKSTTDKQTTHGEPPVMLDLSTNPSDSLTLSDMSLLPTR